MKINQTNLERLKNVHKEKFNIELNDNEALEYGKSIINFLQILIIKNKVK